MKTWLFYVLIIISRYDDDNDYSNNICRGGEEILLRVCLNRSNNEKVVGKVLVHLGLRKGVSAFRPK